MYLGKILKILVTRLAIRSSAVGEDSLDQSCAGQNDTFLAVTGRENVLQSILKCWASLYAFRSVEYRWIIQMILNILDIITTLNYSDDSTANLSLLKCVLSFKKWSFPNWQELYSLQTLSQVQN